MDRLIARFEAEEDGDLMLCHKDGVAYQRDMSKLVAYDAAYYNKCASYEDQEIARKINEGRINLVHNYVGRYTKICDIGIGSGEFIKKRPQTLGYDVNPVAIEWLKRNDLWAERLYDFTGYTFFDVIEHCPEPELYLRQVPINSFVFLSIPIFKRLDEIRTSKHYRPGEHLYYFTDEGLINWMKLHGFAFLEQQDFETEAGREAIWSYAFKRTTYPRETSQPKPVPSRANKVFN